MSAQLNRLDNGTIELTLTFPWTEVQRAYGQAVAEAVNAAELPGFRKGKAPRHLVEPNLDKNRLYSHALQHLLPQSYSQAVKEHNLKPVLYPRITIKSGRENSDWIFLAVTCEAPVVTLPSLDKKSLKIKSETSRTKDQKISAVLDYLIVNSTVKLPDLIVESETDRRLGDLAENLSRLGLSIDKYLESKKIKAEDLRADTLASARKDLTVEFILQRIQIERQIKDRGLVLDYLSGLI